MDQKNIHHLIFELISSAVIIEVILFKYLFVLKKVTAFLYFTLNYFIGKKAAGITLKIDIDYLLIYLFIYFL